MTATIDYALDTIRQQIVGLDTPLPRHDARPPPRSTSTNLQSSLSTLNNHLTHGRTLDQQAQPAERDRPAELNKQGADDRFA